MIKESTFSFILFFLALNIYTQNYVGFSSENYSGIHGVIANPASIVDSRYQVDVNLGSFSSYFGNDYFSASVFDIIKPNYDFNENAEINAFDKNSALSNFDILGPSIMFNLDNKNAMAITTRARAFSSVNNFNGNIISLFDSDINGTEPKEISNINANGTVNIWTEVGLSYGTILYQKKKHFLKAGVSAKYLQSRGHISISTNNASINFDPVNDELNGSGTATYSFSDNFDLDNDERPFQNRNDSDFSAGKRGFSFDLGFTYEWRPNYKKYFIQTIEKDKAPINYLNKYKLRLGASVTDIGFLNSRNTLTNVYDLNTSIDKQVIETGNFEKEIEPLLSNTKSRGNRKINLPAAAHFNIDWNVFRKFYFNVNSDISLVKKDNPDTNRIANSVTATPRFESKWLSIFAPISYREFADDVLIGAGTRIGPLFIGSGSIISNIMNKKSRTLDIYAGIKVPIFHKKQKDTDGDGVEDRFDECPYEAGKIKNKGCPKKRKKKRKTIDTDNDGITDSIDDCPYIAGTEANNGCPEKTTIEYEYDPETITKIQKSLHKNSKTINFGYNSAVIMKSTLPHLRSILKIMQEYENIKFSIEGYTDSIGNSTYNDLLSERRANAVKKYFIDQNIDEKRLISKGLGESNPIATNTTPLGRSKNRRVEIKMIENTQTSH